jgi:hypothetical protein
VHVGALPLPPAAASQSLPCCCSSHAAAHPRPAYPHGPPCALPFPLLISPPPPPTHLHGFMVRGTVLRVFKGVGPRKHHVQRHSAGPHIRQLAIVLQRHSSGTVDATYGSGGGSGLAGQQPEVGEHAAPGERNGTASESRSLLTAPIVRTCRVGGWGDVCGGWGGGGWGGYGWHN